METELGTFDLRAPASGTVHVAVRPEQLELRVGATTATPRWWRASSAATTCSTGCATRAAGRVLVQLPSLELYEVGDRVFVRPAPAAVTSLVD